MEHAETKLNYNPVLFRFFPNDRKVTIKSLVVVTGNYKTKNEYDIEIVF